SNGNAIYVEAGDVRLLFDAGISGRALEERLRALGRGISQVQALVISHDHSDHVRALGIYQRRFGLPVHVTANTLCAATERCRLGRLGAIRHFQAGQTIDFGRVTVETVPTPHDGADGVAFVVDDGERRLGILTDLGHVFRGLDEVTRSLDAVVIESNYDPVMLAGGPYPESLKRRIRGRGGHLSNVEAAHLLGVCGVGRLRWACLAHLSEENNRPELALRTHREILGDRLTLHVASRYGPIGPLEV
ncbi:MAG: MBL fold metallo-hydrolase, partial [Planctomycetota bacterium]